MRYVILGVGFVFFLLSGSLLCAAPEVSSRPEVRENVRQLQEKNSCPGCDFAGAILHRGEFSGANLEGANFAGAQLNLANLSGANLKDANLQGTSFGGTDLAGADLTGANLTGAVLEGAYLSGAKMDGQVVVRRPYVEEGGPGAGETVFEAAEGVSKNLPFTNQPMVKAEKTPEEILPPDESSKPVQISVISQSVPADKKQLRSMPVDSLPEKSKRLSVMGDAVVSEKLQEAPALVAVESNKGAISASQPAVSGENIVVAVVEPEMVPENTPEIERGEVEPVVAVEVVEQEVTMMSEPAVDVAVEQGKVPDEVEPVVTEEVVRQEEEMTSEPAVELAVEQETIPDEVEPVVAAEVIMQKEEVTNEPAVDPDAEKKKMLVEKLLDDNRCVGCDLSGVDLSGKDLDEADLERANLRGANLNDTDLEGANLKGADLRGSDLRGSDLREADLYRADVSGADLTGAKLEGALIDSLIDTDAVGVNFEGTIGTQLSSPFLKN